MFCCSFCLHAVNSYGSEFSEEDTYAHAKLVPITLALSRKILLLSTSSRWSYEVLVLNDDVACRFLHMSLAQSEAAQSVLICGTGIGTAHADKVPEATLFRLSSFWLR